MTTKTIGTQSERGARRREAEAIARAENFPILEHDADWTFFTLDDPLVIEDEGRVIRTHFTWSGSRFEGFVS